MIGSHTAFANAAKRKIVLCDVGKCSINRYIARGSSAQNFSFIFIIMREKIEC